MCDHLNSQSHGLVIFGRDQQCQGKGPSLVLRNDISFCLAYWNWSRPLNSLVELQTKNQKIIKPPAPFPMIRGFYCLHWRPVTQTQYSRKITGTTKQNLLWKSKLSTDNHGLVFFEMSAADSAPYPILVYLNTTRMTVGADAIKTNVSSNCEK